MYKTRLDMTGEVYGRLQAVEFRGKTAHNQAIWAFKCLECGTEIERPAFWVRNGNTKSCGCITRALKSASKVKHGGSNAPEYGSYKSMKNRCLDKKSALYHRYGGRGITVCDRWLAEDGFKSFMQDMGPKPDGDYSIDRIDNNGPYSPENCRWATRGEQMQTRSTTKLLAFDGLEMSIAAWERHLGFGMGVVRDRLNRGWSIDEALTLKPVPSKRPRGRQQ